MVDFLSLVLTHLHSCLRILILPSLPLIVILVSVVFVHACFTRGTAPGLLGLGSGEELTDIPTSPANKQKIPAMKRQVETISSWNTPTPQSALTRTIKQLHVPCVHANQSIA